MSTLPLCRHHHRAPPEGQRGRLSLVANPLTENRGPSRSHGVGAVAIWQTLQQTTGSGALPCAQWQHPSGPTRSRRGEATWQGCQEPGCASLARTSTAHAVPRPAGSPLGPEPRK